MLDRKKLLDQSFLEMRGRCLSLAADLDRLDRADGEPVDQDQRMVKLRQAIGVLLLEGQSDRAQRVQMTFSDTTPPPHYRQ
jgi:uncharacterized coiled-coil protein SlyX